MNDVRTKIDMENVAPPKVEHKNGDPEKAAPNDCKNLGVEIVRSIAGAAAAYNDKCTGGDDFPNDCAHFLSDAFIRAGYNEIANDHSCVESGARCYTSAKRPIRARNMWCWFKRMATESRTSLPTNEGFWAVFQLDESAYWGGHVVIIDTNNNKYYGTGNFSNWDQYAYKW